MNLEHFGMDTVTLLGPLEGKLRAMREAGFTQVMLDAGDLASHPGGERAAIAAVRASGLRPTGLQVLEDFEGLDGAQHAYKLELAKAMLRLCGALGCRLLLVSSSISEHASGDRERIVRDLRKLALLAVPCDVRIAYEPLSWARHVSDLDQAADLVQDADRANLGLALDAFHMLARGTDLEALDAVDPCKVFVAQLSDFLWPETGSARERIDTGRHHRVFPGEGAHSAQLAAIVRWLDGIGYRGDYSFEVFNDDDQRLPPPAVAARARRAAKWVTDHVSRRSLPARQA